VKIPAIAFAPPELAKLRQANAAYCTILRDMTSWTERQAEVFEIANPPYAEMLARLLDELRAAANDHESGTPAVIGRVVAELLGEA